MAKKSKKQTPPEIIKQLLYVIIPGIVFAILNIIVKQIAPNSADDVINLATYVILLVLIWIIFFKSSRSESKKWSLLVVSLTTIVIVGGLIYFLQTVLKEKRTVYFILDASENMQGLFEEVMPRIKLQATSVPDKFEIGLAVFGGSINGDNSCNDITHLVQPSLKNISLPEISQTIDLISEIKPHGVGNLQNAIKSTIIQLANRKGIQQIVVITTKIDNRCDVLDRTVIENIAIQNKVELEIVIITVGTINENDVILYESYANRYISLGEVVELPETIINIFNSPPSAYYPYGTQQAP